MTVDVSAFYYRLDHFRGAALAFLHMVEGLARRRHNLKVFSFSFSPPYIERLEKAGIAHVTVDGDFQYRTLVAQALGLPATMGRMRALAKDMGGADMAFCDGHRFAPYLFPHLEIPTVFWLDEPPRGFYEENLWRMGPRARLGALLDLPFKWCLKRLDVKCTQLADVIIANSDYSRNYVRRVYGDVNVRTIYLGVDLELYRPRPVKKDILLSVGALTVAKQHDFVIRAVSRLRDPPPLVLVGKGEEEAGLRRLADERGVDLRIEGEISFEKMSEYYNRALLTAVAYIREPFGLVAIESMACGTPVVAVGEGGLLESVVDDSTGFLVLRDEGRFAGAMERILKNPRNAGEMGKAGRARVEKEFSWDKCVDRLEGSMKGLLAAGKGETDRGRERVPRPP